MRKKEKKDKKDKFFQMPETEVITFEDEVVVTSGCDEDCPVYGCSGVCTGNCKKISK